MAKAESARPLPPLTPPPSKGSGSYPAPAGRLSEPPPGLADPENVNTEGITPGGFQAETAIDAQLSELERWALANLQRDRQQLVRFWLLKGAAFIGASVAAVAAALTAPRVAIGFATLAALCTAIDAAWPSSSFRNAHQRAVQDLRELQNNVKLKWDKVRLAHPDPTAPSRIAHALALLDHIQSKREEIGKYLGGAEASPDVRISN
jgi:hypothetical protein